MQTSSGLFCKKCKAFFSNFESEVSKGHLSELLAIPSFLLDMYEFKSLIGSGGFGIVLKGLHKLENECYAIKVMSLSLPGLEESQIKENTTDLLNEIKINVQIQHENIIRYITSFQFPSENIVAIVMELAETSIDKLMNKLSKEMSLEFIKQICTGLDYLHNQKKIIHRDLKPQNLLVLKGKIKICDFGFSKIEVNDSTLISRIIGTPDYMAPELLNEDDNIDCKVDIWALGIIIHQMMTNGLQPFGIKGKIKSNMQKGDYFIDVSVQDQNIIEIIKGCFEVDPRKRFDIQQILTLLMKNSPVKENMIVFHEIQNFYEMEKEVKEAPLEKEKLMEFNGIPNFSYIEMKFKGLIHWRIKGMKEIIFEILDRLDFFFPEEMNMSLNEYLEEIRIEAKDGGWAYYFSNILKKYQAITRDNFFCFILNLYIYLNENHKDPISKYFTTAFCASLEYYGRRTIKELKNDGLINNASKEVTVYMDEEDTNIIPIRQVGRFAICQNNLKSILKKMETIEYKKKWILYEIQILFNSDPMNSDTFVYLPNKLLLNPSLSEKGIFILKPESFLLTQGTKTIEVNVSFPKIQAFVTNDLDNHLELLEKSINKCVFQINENKYYSLYLSKKELANTNPQKIKLLAKEMEKNKLLTSLYLCNNLLVNAKKTNLEILAKALEKNTSINYFGLHNLAKVNSENVYLLAKVIEKNKKIFSLDLSHNDIGQVNFENLTLLMKALEKNTKIWILDLSRNNLGRANIENLELLVTFFEKNQNITKLNFSNNNLGNTSIKNMELFAKIIENHPNLRYLYLSGNDLGNTNPENMKLLANAIEKNKKIGWLYFSDNNLGSGQNMELFAKAIERNGNIYCLQLNNNDLGSENNKDMEFFANAIQKNKEIKWLNLQKNNMGKMDQKNLEIFGQAIEKKMPKFDRFQLSLSKSERGSTFEKILQKIKEKSKKLYFEFH